MRTIQNHYKAITICSLLVGLIFLAGLLIKPTQAYQMNGSHWLDQFEGKIIVITFITNPPGKQHTERARLDSVDSMGIVVKSEGLNPIFYTFANIISIDPQ